MRDLQAVSRPGAVRALPSILAGIHVNRGDVPVDRLDSGRPLSIMGYPCPEPARTQI